MENPKRGHSELEWVVDSELGGYALVSKHKKMDWGNATALSPLIVVADMFCVLCIHRVLDHEHKWNLDPSFIYLTKWIYGITLAALSVLAFCLILRSSRKPCDKYALIKFMRDQYPSPKELDLLNWRTHKNIDSLGEFIWLKPFPGDIA